MRTEGEADARKEAAGERAESGLSDSASNLPRISAELLLRVLACVVIAVSLVHWVMQSAVLVISKQGTPDFSDYFTAALILRDNAHAHLYDPQLLRATANLHHTFLVRNYAFYLYPPLLAILMIPLTFFPFLTAARIWMCISFILWILTTALVADLLRYALQGNQWRTEGTVSAPASRRFSRVMFARGIRSVRSLSDVTVISLALATFLCLTSYTLELGVSLGQVAMLILFLILLAPWLIRRGHPMLGGAALALAAVIKVFPLALLGYYVLRGRWRVVAGAASALALMIAGMTLVIGPAGMLAAPAAIFADGRASGMQFQNQSLARIPLWVAAMFGRNPGSLSGKVGYGLVALAALAFCAGILFVRRKTVHRVGENAASGPNAMPLDLLGYAWATATMLLLAPNSWPHDFSWLLPVVVFCIGVATRRLAKGLRTSEGRLKMEVFVVAFLALGYAVTMFELPFQYDGAELFSLGPRFFIFWVRPFFMIERPIGAIVIWLCAGILFLRCSLDNVGSAERAYQAAETKMSPLPATVGALEL